MATLATEPVTHADRAAGRARRLVGPLGLAGVCLAGAAALHLRDPHESGSWGFCPFLVVTGHPCPGCGGLRAVNDLTNLDVVSAASSNLLFVASLPLLAFLWVRWAAGAWTGSPPRPLRHGTALVVAGLAAVLLFWLVRSLPFGAWLAP
ncbi:DUF2752 domain-containing protein [Nocardioides cavernaquae]|uniref:DUF2752 domain-containing protein n=1 Tax=Nocardioides cavernaquae TaxID=2321396 RepID=A0A3A5H9D2_9ACTN|nr:DUF2752 domain-containing protein [Nocardioides cavernaquae]RJS46992.1 DUF2752 domain-containing protein [Nocardioides cavernaquae]